MAYERLPKLRAVVTPTALVSFPVRFDLHIGIFKSSLYAARIPYKCSLVISGCLPSGFFLIRRTVRYVSASLAGGRIA